MTNVYDEETKFRTFEARGVEYVRLELERGGFNPEWRAAALKWMGLKGKEAERRAEAVRHEQVAIARDTAKATWAGAFAAIVAAVVSVVAAIISFASAAHMIG